MATDADTHADVTARRCLAAARSVVTASAPGRICLAGESLDWMVGGSSIVAAIPSRTRVTAWRAAGSAALAFSSGAPLGRTRLVPAAELGAYLGDPLEYLQAATRVAVAHPDELAGLVLTASTDLPVGAGMSSSAALTLAAVAALLALTRGAEPDLATVCALARQAEVGELRTGAGWMDFLACGYGGVNRVLAAATPQVRPIAASLGVPVVLVDTLARRTTRAVLASKRERFRAGEPGMLAYVDATERIVEELAAVLGAPAVDYAQVGRLLTQAHVQLRDRVRCSTELIDACIDKILRAGGYGAKLSGSGHGGCLFALVPDGAVDAVLAALATLPVYAVALPATEPSGVTYSWAVRRDDAALRQPSAPRPAPARA